MKPNHKIAQEQPGQSESWNRFRLGDLSAFESLYKNYTAQLYAYGMTMTPDDAVVKDAIQQVFEDLWKYKASLSDVSNPGFYLIRCLRNILVRQLQESRKFRAVQVSEAYDYESLPSSEKLMIEADTLMAQKKEIRILINELPPRQREVLVLIFFEGLSYEDASAILSISVPSVYTLVWRSISSLRKKYGLS